MKKVIILIMAFILLALTACSSVSQDTIVIENNYDRDGPIPLIMPRASRDEIHQYFSDRIKGDLYIGEIVRIELRRRDDTSSYIYFTYSDGTTVMPGVLSDGTPLTTGCYAILFNKGWESIPKFDRIASCKN